jgi:predicted glycoside hydrolase/deacetylase ChbG (UPF0249 family)
MELQTVTLKDVGVRGIAPQGWSAEWDGQHARRSSPDDHTALHQRLLPHTDAATIWALLMQQFGLSAPPRPSGAMVTGRAEWTLYRLATQPPGAGEMAVDVALAQEGAWVYLILLFAAPEEGLALHESVFLPAVQAYVPLPDEFGLINGGPPDRAPGPTLAEELGYPADRVLLIVHADDMAAHRDQTDGALDAFAAGMCKTGGVMVPCPDFPRTLEIWKQRPELDLGVHLTLNSEWGARYGWRAVLPRRQVPSLYTPGGLLWPTPPDLRQHMHVDEALREMEAQLQRVLEAGVQPTHMDDHMGCYWLTPELQRGAMQLARRYGLPMNPIHIREMRAQGHVVPDAVWLFLSNILTDALDPDVRRMTYDDWMRRLRPGVHLLVTHIARMSDGYRSLIPQPYYRAGDHAYWTSAATRRLAEDLGITFIGYRELQQLQARKWA